MVEISEDDISDTGLRPPVTEKDATLLLIGALLIVAALCITAMRGDAGGTSVLSILVGLALGAGVLIVIKAITDKPSAK